MSDLRKEIIDDMRGLYDSYGFPDSTPTEGEIEAADRILAVVAEALTTQDAVSHAIVAHQKAEHTSPMAAAITAALRAAGIVKGEGDE